MRRPLLTWILTGVGLDAAALMFIWLLLDAIGPLGLLNEYWLDLLGLAVVVWLVHVVALPAILRLTWVGTNRLLVPTVAFCGLAAMLIPIIGIAVAFFIGLPLFGFLSFLGVEMPWAIGASPSWIVRTTEVSFWLITATIAGLFIGCLLHALRPGDIAERLPLPRHRHPRIRSDTLGGAIAAFLAFGAMILALSFGLFTRTVEVPGNGMPQLATAPQLPATIVIGVIALLPHLLLVGKDLFRCNLRKESESE